MLIPEPLLLLSHNNYEYYFVMRASSQIGPLTCCCTSSGTISGVGSSGRRERAGTLLLGSQSVAIPPVTRHTMTTTNGTAGFNDKNCPNTKLPEMAPIRPTAANIPYASSVFVEGRRRGVRFEKPNSHTPNHLTHLLIAHAVENILYCKCSARSSPPLKPMKTTLIWQPIAPSCSQTQKPALQYHSIALKWLFFFFFFFGFEVYVDVVSHMKPVCRPIPFTSPPAQQS